MVVFFAVDMFNNHTIPDVISMSYGWAEDDHVQSLHVEISPHKTMIVHTEYIKLGL